MMNKTSVFLIRISALPLFIAGFVLAILPNSIDAQTESQAKVVGVSVSLPDPDSEYGGGAVFGQQPGTAVYVQVRNEELFFTGLAKDGDEDKTSMKLLDETGKEIENENSFSSFGFGTNVSEDGHTVTIPVNASGLPPKDAGRIQVKGTIVLVVAKDEKTDEVAMELEQGAKLKLGNVDVRISEIEKDPYGDDGWALSFESSQSMDAIAELTFLDGSGKEMESNSTGGYESGFSGEMTYSRSYMVNGKTDKLSVRVRYFQTTEELEIPVDLPVTLGLQK